MATDSSPGIVSNIASNVINKFERKIIGVIRPVRAGIGAVRAEKGFTLFISNEDMDDFIKITKSLEYLGVLTDGVTETVKHEIKKQEGGFLGAALEPLADTFGTTY